MTTQLLENRRGLVVGIANERSLAFGIARAARRHGAKLCLTYQNERFKDNVAGIGESLDAPLVLPCDVGDDGQIEALGARLRDTWGSLDFVVHAVAAARREELEGLFVNTSRAGFALAMDISVYSLVALTRVLQPLLEKGQAPSILTLSYHASQKAMPNYNVMGVAKAALESTVRYLAQDLGPRGIRVNALSAGPVRTLSSAGVKGLRRMLARVEQDAPLRRNVTIDDVGDGALMALSELGRGMTGEVYHIDSGYHCIGAPAAGDALTIGAVAAKGPA